MKLPFFSFWWFTSALLTIFMLAFAHFAPGSDSTRELPWRKDSSGSHWCQVTVDSNLMLFQCRESSIYVLLSRKDSYLYTWWLEPHFQSVTYKPFHCTLRYRVVSLCLFQYGLFLAVISLCLLSLLESVMCHGMTAFTATITDVCSITSRCAIAP